MANDLISRKALITDLRTAKGLGSIIAETIVRFLKKQPTVDAVEVVHGEWVWKDLNGDGSLVLCCSACLGSDGARETAHFCSECGAKMDGGAGCGKT